MSENARLKKTNKKLTEALEWIAHHAEQDGCEKKSLKTVAKSALKDENPPSKGAQGDGLEFDITNDLLMVGFESAMKTLFECDLPDAVRSTVGFINKRGKMYAVNVNLERYTTTSKETES